MSFNDPISDMLTRIRNAQMAAKAAVRMPSSKQKVNIAEVLKGAGYISDYRTAGDDKKPTLEISLKYMDGQPVIELLERASRPGLRRYVGKGELPRVHGGLGVAVVSTSAGVMTDAQARRDGHGGEVLCYVA